MNLACLLMISSSWLCSCRFLPLIPDWFHCSLAPASDLPSILRIGLNTHTIIDSARTYVTLGVSMDLLEKARAV
jgi:hypothetical protein